MVTDNFDAYFPNYIDKAIYQSTISKIKEEIEEKISQYNLSEEEIICVKELLEKRLQRCVIPAGTAVGVITSQSIGERQTQLCLDSFHSSGLSLSTVTTGVPRFMQLINCSSQTKSTCKFKLRKKVKNIAEVQTIINSSIRRIYFKDMIKNVSIGTYEKNLKPWYECFEFFFPLPKGSRDNKEMITVSYTLDKNILYRNKLSLSVIRRKLENEIEDDIVIMNSPLYLCQIDLIIPKELFFKYIHDSNEVIDSYFDNHFEDFIKIFYINILKQKIDNIPICGIDKINDYYIDIENGEYIISTEGSNLESIYKLDYIDKSSVQSSDLWDVFNIFGIEGARKFLIEELFKVVSSDGNFINGCHISLLADTMCNSGSLTSISRYGIKKDEKSVLSKSSFEESLDHFTQACLFQEEDKINSISASIMTAKHAIVGSGLCKIIPNWNLF